MEILQKRKIKSLNAINDGTDVVVNVVVEWHTYANIDPEEYFLKEDKKFTLEIDEVNPQSDSFIPFNQLTEDIVCGWIQHRFESPKIKEMEKRMIGMVNSMAYPTPLPEPEIIGKEIPW
jgi:hypothetical protein